MLANHISKINTLKHQAFLEGIFYALTLHISLSLCFYHFLVGWSPYALVTMKSLCKIIAERKNYSTRKRKLDVKETNKFIHESS